VVVGGLSGAVALLARRAFQPATRVPRFVRRLPLLPVDVVADAFALTRLLVSGRVLRADCGKVDDVDLPDDSDADAIRAWAVLVTSAAPGSLAVDAVERDGRLVLRRHRLTSRGRSAADVGQR
jgi:hypothetical protein